MQLKKLPRANVSDLKYLWAANINVLGEHSK